jgi:tetratricopeptide (TPR) repeat protein
MWQPPSLERLREFFWSGQGYGFLATLREPTLSLSAVLGPFLLLPLLGFLLWRMEAFDRVPWRRLDRSVDRARLFALIWLCAVIAAISSLAAINYTFRIRYGILPMVPVALLLAWCLGLVSESWSKEIAGMAKKLPDWALTAFAVLFGVQCLLNLARSARYRHDMGQVMVAVDQVYEEVAEHHAADRLTLLPDFRPYDYRPNAPRLFAEKTVLGDGVDLVKKGYMAGATSVISWTPSLWDRLEVMGHYSGCRTTTLFDWVYPCARGTGTWLMRFIASDPDYAKGEELRAKGDLNGALRLHEGFVTRHPMSPAGYFVVGLEAYQLKDYTRADQAYAWLEEALPEHLSILYNHALAFEGLGRFKDAVTRLDFIVGREPRNYAALIHLYWDVRKDGQTKRAHELLVAMKREFPQDAEIDRLLAGGSG